MTPVPAPQKPTVFIVEDDSFLLNLLRVRFSKESMDVVTASDGVEALEKARTIRPAIILLDLILPRKNGFEVLQEIGQDPQLHKIPVIIISNLGQDSDIEKGKALGAVEYYVKARLSIDELVSKVREFIGPAQE
jgi:DNA-binding response OmpR family regulator